MKFVIDKILLYSVGFFFLLLFLLWLLSKVFGLPWWGMLTDALSRAWDWFNGLFNSGGSQKPDPNTGNKDRFPSNNNVGNIRRSDVNLWIGKDMSWRGEFERFDTMENGARAMMKLLRNYIAWEFNTIAKVITKYSPATDSNPTVAYYKWVASKMGISEHKQLTNADVPRLAFVMSRFEQGRYVQTETWFSQVYAKFFF